jgi:hypothetical protein
MAISLREFTDINPPMFQDKAPPTEVGMGEMSIAPSEYKLPDNVGKSGGEYLKAVGPAIEAERKAQTEKDIFASEAKTNEFVGKAKMGERMAEAYKTEKANIEGSPEFANLRKLEDELMNTEFIPTQDNAKDLGGLFSLIGVVGWAIGGSGKDSAIQAMTAMNGMLSGYQKGRTDLYKREKDTFDTKMKALQTKTLTLSNRLKQIAELAAIDTKAANQEADNLFNQEQATFYKQYKDKFGLSATVEFAKNNVKAIDEAFKIKLKEEENAAKKKEEAKLGASQRNMNQRVLNALGGVSSIGEVIQMVPAGATTGILPNLQTKDGMYNFVRNFSTRQISGDEAQALEVLYSGVARNLAAIEASGAATGLVGLATQMAKLEPRAGDSAYTVALKIADMRRIATEMTRPLINSGLLDPKQEQEAIRLVTLIEKTIPYTVQDVISANPKFANRKTIGERSQELVNKGNVKGAFATEAEADTAFQQGRIKKGDRIKIGNATGVYE